MKQDQTNIHKEFELERLILFSDAVFAIAITLLIIEIKFPEIPKDTPTSDLFHLFHHTLIQFATFTLSFLIIGGYWLRHLKLCRYLKNYDDGLIVRNLFFLFFIVVFPFSAASMGHFKPSFFLPLYIYVTNILMLTISHYIIAYYTLRKKPQLTVYGNESEKTYLLLKAKLPIFMLSASLVIIIIVAILFPKNQDLQAYSFLSLSVFAFINKRVLKKYQPKKIA